MAISMIERNVVVGPFQCNCRLLACPKTGLAALAEDRVLIIGDSHSYGVFGRHLRELIQTRSDTLASLHASWGSAPHNWLFESAAALPYFSIGLDGAVYEDEIPTPKIQELLDAVQPSLVVIALGANLIRGKFSDEAVAQTTIELAFWASGQSRCAWVGPPRVREYGGEREEHIYSILKRASSPCTFVDLRPFAEYPEGGDGLHYDSAGETGKALSRHLAQSAFARIFPLQPLDISR